MGTELIALGIQTGACNEYLNIDSAGIISDIHDAYLLAVSDVIITNTFGANKCTLARHISKLWSDEQKLPNLRC